MQTIRRMLSGLTERSLYLIALVLILGYCLPIATRLSTMLMAMVLVPWGLTMAYRRFREYAPLKQPHFRFAAAGAIIYLIACSVSRDAVADWRDFVYLVFIFTFGLMMVPGKTTLRDMHNELFWVSSAFSLVYLPFQLLSLVSVFTGETFSIPFVRYRLGLQAVGDYTGRIYVLFNPNVAARYSCCIVIFCLYIIFSRRSKLLKLFSSLCVLINTMVIVHTQSRACYIGLALVSAAIVFRAVYLLLVRFRLRIPVGALAAVVSFFIVLSMLDAIFVADLRIAQSLAPTAETEASETHVETRSEAEGMFDVTTTGRGVVWSSALKYLRDNPRYIITGMGPMSPIAEISESYPEILTISSPGKYLHNSFLTALVHGGIFYLISALAFLVTLVRPCWRMLLAPCKEENRGLFMVPIAIAMLLAFSLVEEAIFLSASITNLFFHLFSGLIFHWNELTERN